MSHEGRELLARRQRLEAAIPLAERPPVVVITGDLDARVPSSMRVWGVHRVLADTKFLTIF